MTTIPDKKRIYTIENGSRELALVRREDGRVMNSIIHTLTRDSENERQKVDQIALLDMALRFNPDVVVVGEMRGPEANAAQEAARTGMAVVTKMCIRDSDSGCEYPEVVITNYDPGRQNRPEQLSLFSLWEEAGISGADRAEREEK